MRKTEQLSEEKQYKRKRWVGKLFVVLLLFSLIAGFVVYTALTSTASITVNGGGTEYATVTASGYTLTAKPIGSGSGKVDSGELFDVVRDADYTGDLSVFLALTNSGDLSSEYVSLIVNVAIKDATAAVIDSETILLETSIVEMTIEAADTGPFTIEVTGGSFKVLKGVDPTTAVDFYCRVGQR